MLDTSKHSRITLPLNFLPLIVVVKLITLYACVLPRLDFQPFETRLIETSLHPPPAIWPGRGRTRWPAALVVACKSIRFFDSEKPTLFVGGREEKTGNTPAVRRLPCRSIGKNWILSTYQNHVGHLMACLLKEILYSGRAPWLWWLGISTDSTVVIRLKHWLCCD